MKFTKEWEDLTHKMGYWVDMTDPYITYDNRYIETLWWLLKQLYTKGYLYKGYTIQPYSPAAGTGLSSHELNQPGCYRDVKDDLCGTVQDEEPEAGNGRVGNSVLLSMDHDSVDIAFEYRALRRPEDRLCSRTKLQRIHRRENHRCTCQSFALHALQ